MVEWMQHRHARQANTLKRLFKSTVIGDVNGVKAEIADLRKDI